MSVETKAPSVPMVTLTIDGQEVQVPKGTNVIEAARKIGIDIPYLCYHHQLTSFGGCRLCLVEVEKVPKMLAACNTIVADGMVVRTQGERIQSQRAGTLEFILLNHPLDCPVCDKGGECELQDRVFEFSNATSRATEPKIHVQDYDLGPLIVRNQDRCIICKRCVKVMEEVVGDPVLEFGQRGVTTEVYTFEHGDFPAGFSGNTIRVCPVGALMSKPFRFRARPWELIKTPSVCSLCSVGCNLREDVRENKLLRVVGLENKQVNDGWLCDRGQFGYDYINSEKRLTTPLVRRASGEFEEVSWEEAYRTIAAQLKGLKPEQFGAIGSERTTNEDSFALQEFTRKVIGSPNIDHRMGSTRTGYASRPKAGAIQSLEKADVVLLVGTDLTAEAPVMDLILKRGLLKKTTKAILAHPRRTALTKFSHQWLQCTPGQEIALLNALTKAIIESGQADTSLGLQAVEQGFGGRSVAQLAELAGVGEAAVREAAALFAGAKLGSILYGQAAADARDGAYLQAAVNNLAIVAGQAGKEGHLALEVVQETNTWGARDMGVLPESGPAGAKAATRGLSTGEMLQAAIEGKIKVLYVSGSNPALDYVSAAKAEQALENVGFLVVEDLFLTETAQFANVVLPLVSHAERNGTVTNIEGRVQRLVRGMDPRGSSKESWAILSQLSEELGKPLGYHTGDAVLKAMREAFTGKEAAVPAGLQRVETPQPSTTDANFPLRLYTGRLMFDRGTVQRESAVLPGLAPEPFAELHPTDAARLGVVDGEKIGVITVTGRLDVTARVTDDTPAGSVFVPSGYAAAAVSSVWVEGLDVLSCRISRAAE